MRSRLVFPIWGAVACCLIFPCAMSAEGVAAENSQPGPDRSTTVWPLADSLVQEIADLQSIPYMQRWAGETESILESLQELDPYHFASVKAVFAQLDAQTASLKQLQQPLADQVAANPAYIELLSRLQRLDYALERRIDIWKMALASNRVSSSRKLDPQPFRSASHGMISFGGLDDSWAEYFELADIRKEFNSLNPDAARQQQAARRTLSRIYSPVLKDKQADYARQVFDPALVSLFREKASTPQDRVQMLKRLEQHEAAPSGLTAYRLNDAYQNYLWSENESDQAVAEKIHAHYRNANVRMSISGTMLNRMIPQMPVTHEPVSEKVMGATVSGRSDISNQLYIQLLPDPEQVHVRVQTAGTVHSSTVAHRDGFAIQNEGLARFQVFKRLAFGRDGIDSSEQPVAWSTANQRVVGMQSRLDGVPVVGWMARRIASQKIQEQTPRAEQMVRSKVERSASDRMQVQVEEQLLQMRTKMYKNVLQPLLAMDLEPEPVEMSTTERDIVMRYRLAGRDQMAANTARPQAMPGGLFNVQLHDSAVNNAIARIGLNGNRFSADELKSHLQNVLGMSATDDSTDEEGHQAEFEFAHFDPLAIRFDEERVTISLNLKSLQIGEGKKWQRLSVRATYVPHVEGMNIVLEQDDSGIRLTGKRLRFRDQIAVRTVFEILFKEQYKINALPSKMASKLDADSLAMSQLVLSDGWLGMTVSDRVALAPKPKVGSASSSFGNRSRRMRR